MLRDRREDLGIVDSVPFPRELGSEAGVEHDRVAAFERVDRHRARLAFGEEPRGLVESREVVQHPGDPRAIGILAVSDRESFGETRDADAVRVAVILADVGPNRASQRDERGQRPPPEMRAKSSFSSVRSRAR